MVSLEVKVIDGLLDYNLLLCRTWVYSMGFFVSTYSKMTDFPHKGGIVSIDQITLFSTNSQVTRIIPLVGETPHWYQHVRVGLLKDSSLMRTFSLAPHFPKKSNPVSHLNMIYSCTTPTNPWEVSDESKIDTFRYHMPLISIELDCEAIYLACVPHSTLSSSIN